MDNLKKKMTEAWDVSNDMDEIFHYDDVKDVIVKDQENLWNLIGMLSGLKLTYDIPINAMCKINELTADYLNKKEELFGDFEE